MLPRAIEAPERVPAGGLPARARGTPDGSGRSRAGGSRARPVSPVTRLGTAGLDSAQHPQRCLQKAESWECYIPRGNTQQLTGLPHPLPAAWTPARAAPTPAVPARTARPARLLPSRSAAQPGCPTHRGRSRAPRRTQDLLPALRVGLLRVDPLEVVAGDTVPHSACYAPRRAALPL